MAMSREHRVLAVAFRMPYSTKKTSCGVDALGKEVNTRVSLVKLQQVFYHLHNRGSFIENKNAQKRITSASTELLSVPRSEGLERALSCNSILDGPVEGSGRFLHGILYTVTQHCRLFSVTPHCILGISKLEVFWPLQV